MNASPRPWCIDPEYPKLVLHENKQLIARCERGTNNQACSDAALIVRAVNAHDDLVKALRLTMTVLAYAQGKDIVSDNSPCMVAARAALAKAEAGE